MLKDIGKKLGLEDVRGTMFFYYAEFFRQLQPKMFLAENVKGLTTHDGGRTGITRSEFKTKKAINDEIITAIPFADKSNPIQLEESKNY